MNIDLRILELVASKICHDLISPIGAVNNGLELMEDEQDTALQTEALALAQRSARRASILLQIFRSLFGNAGNQAGFGPKEVRQLALEFLQNGKVTLDPEFAVQGVLPEGFGKLLLAAIIVAAEALPRGGTVTVSLPLTPGETAFSVVGVGGQVAFSEENVKALQLTLLAPDLTAHSSLPYFTGLLAKRAGIQCQIDQKTSGQIGLHFAA
ncbi:MAG TPA: histidine phosphotransferase family protein [Dongiaceae bacterium]|nr:histidine phosphotransferase family protein [Dongiaceae bacterium]